MIHLENFPAELKCYKRWIYWVWRTLPGGGQTKMPVFPGQNGRLISSGHNRPEAWMTFDEAVAGKPDHVAGYGFHFTGMDEEDQLIAVDVDDCVVDGEVSDQARVYLEWLKSYAELSPSGTGLRILTYGKLPGRRSKDVKNKRVEFFHRSGWVTITGEMLDGPARVVRNQDALSRLYYNIFPDQFLKAQDFSSLAVASGEAKTQWARELLAAISPSRADDYWHWLEIGMALKSVSPDLIAEWHEFSAQSPKYDGADAIRDKWDSFCSDGVTIGTLHYLAELDGYAAADGSPARPSAAKTDTQDAVDRLIESMLIDDFPKIRYHNETFWGWEGGRYVALSSRGEVLPAVSRTMSSWYWKSTCGFVSSVMDVFRGAVMLPRAIDVPGWIEPHEWAAEDCIVCANGILHLPTMEIRDATPQLFCTTVLGCEFNPGASVPELWTTFLDQLWGDQDEAETFINLLQMWFGYCLTTDTSLQKMLLMMGPSRSGKSTIVRVLTALLGGEDSVGSGRLSDFNQQFGLESLIGKALTVFGDVRLPKKPGGYTEAIQNLLSIVGEDEVKIPRKFKSACLTRLKTKLMLLCNELPSLEDESAALMNRYVILETNKSFAGREDTTLGRRLCEPESLSGLLNWAIEGLVKLRLLGDFEEPEATQPRRADLREDTSPVETFLQEHTRLAPGSTVPTRDLYNLYLRYCGHSGDDPLHITAFAKTVSTARGQVRRERRRVPIHSGSVSHGRKRCRCWVGIELINESETEF